MAAWRSRKPKRLRALQDENAKLKRMPAEATPDNACPKGSRKLVTPDAKRKAVARFAAFLGMSERRACRVIGADWKSMCSFGCRWSKASCAYTKVRGGWRAATPALRAVMVLPAATEMIGSAVGCALWSA